MVETWHAASTTSFEMCAPAVDHDGVVLLDQERGELAEHVLAEVAGCSSASGGPTRKKPSGSRVTKPSNSAWSMRSRFSPTSTSVYCGEAPSCMATSLPVQSRSISTVETLALRQHGGEIDGQRGGADAALGAEEGVDLAQLALAPRRVARRALEAAHGVAELGALERLHQEFVGAGAHALDHGLAVGVEVATHHEQVGRGLLDLLDRLDGALGIAREIDDQAGVRMPLQVLQHADIEVGGHLLILGDNLGFGKLIRLSRTISRNCSSLEATIKALY